jgi:hypothetical protein
MMQPLEFFSFFFNVAIEGQLIVVSFFYEIHRSDLCAILISDIIFLTLLVFLF